MTAAIAEAYTAQLDRRRPRELAAGTTLYGPHRDDLLLFANTHDLRLYGSRGQQRTAALSLKLAEVQVMTECHRRLTAAAARRRHERTRRAPAQHAAPALGGVRQAILTTTDWDDFTPDFRREAQLYTVL